MNTRIKQLRKEILKLTQTSFGEKIGLTGAAITRIEKGNNQPTEQTILSICREFNVNEKWLKTGNGEIFQSLSETEELMKYTALMLKNTDSSMVHLIKNLIITYEQLNDNNKKALEEIAIKYIENLKKDQ